ncbi:hypothetical protein I0C86_15850 [Plantactinospora sp. S1510]|uniref:Uncharacterized protein n=1 Tax=Plantactinospora alkalitolerans TaxID=2789879 RepID=A0ABS0GW58_9ACTN|nr:hypothetical protein [Plantactinospora alkalitolerans]MBF9130421.1 hypothetical protein [Plantactinospora alkalitolerans]
MTSRFDLPVRAAVLLTIAAVAILAGLLLFTDPPGTAPDRQVPVPGDTVPASESTATVPVDTGTPAGDDGEIPRA